MKVTAGLEVWMIIQCMWRQGQMNVSAGMFHLRGQKNMEC